MSIEFDDVIIHIHPKSETNDSANISKLVTIRSPIVGIIHTNKPDGTPYIQKGQHVEVNDVLCVIEAMKIQHEIINQQSGVVVTILVNDKELVEFDQPLFEIR